MRACLKSALFSRMAKPYTIFFGDCEQNGLGLTPEVNSDIGREKIRIGRQGIHALDAQSENPKEPKNKCCAGDAVANCEMRAYIPPCVITRIRTRFGRISTMMAAILQKNLASMR